MKVLIGIILTLLVFTLLGCIDWKKTVIKASGLSEKEIEELGLAEVFGIEVKKPNVSVETRVEIPKFVGLAILYINYTSKVYPDSYYLIDVLIGNNYGGESAGNIRLYGYFPTNFKIVSVDAGVTNPNDIVRGNNYFYVKYDKILPGEGDVVSVQFKTPKKEETGNVRMYYPLIFVLDYYYSVIYHISLPATSFDYYKQTQTSGEVVKIDRTSGEISLNIELDRNVVVIPNEKFGGQDVESYEFSIPIRVQNIGGGIVKGDVTLYAIGIKKEGYLNTSVYGEGWNCNFNVSAEADNLRDRGLTTAADILEKSKNLGFSVCKTNIPSNDRVVLLKVKLTEISPQLQNTIFKIPLYVIATYEYSIPRNVYIEMEKV